MTTYRITDTEEVEEKDALRCLMKMQKGASQRSRLTCQMLSPRKSLIVGFLCPILQQRARKLDKIRRGKQRKKCLATSDRSWNAQRVRVTLTSLRCPPGDDPFPVPRCRHHQFQTEVCFQVTTIHGAKTIFWKKPGSESSWKLLSAWPGEWSAVPSQPCFQHCTV